MTEEALYDGFVSKVLEQVQNTNAVDLTAKRQKLATAIYRVRNARGVRTHAANKTAVGRYVMGEDDQTYAQSGLAVLWTTSAYENEANGIPLAPDALYSPGEVTNGIRQGLVAALKQERRTLKAKGAGQLQTLLPMLVSVMRALGVDDEFFNQLQVVVDGVPDSATDDQKKSNYEAAKNYVIDGLRLLRKWFTEASNDEVKDHIVNQIENTVAASSKEKKALQWQLSGLIQEIADVEQELARSEARVREMADQKGIARTNWSSYKRFKPAFAIGSVVHGHFCRLSNQ